MNKLIIGIASSLNAMLDHREALGFSRWTHESSLMNFDRYCATNYPGAVSLTKKMALGWIDEQLEKPRSSIGEKVTVIRFLGKYLSAIGQEAYILPSSYVSRRKSFTPYIFY